MRVLLSGVSSFLGLALAKELLDAGHEVFAPLRVKPGRAALPLAGKGFHLFPGDMEERTVLRQNLERELTAAEALPLDLCFHLAWGGVGQRGRMDREIQERNLAASEDMLALAAEFGAKRFLFAGSQAEYGVTLERVRRGEFPDSAYDETTPCRPISEYGRAKLAFSARGGEMAARLGVDYRHLRIFSVYGPGDHETSLVASAVRAARTGEAVSFSLCAQQWNFLALADAVRALRLLGEAETLQTDGNPVFNVGSLDTRELRRFVEEIFETAGKPTSLAHFAPRETGPEGTPYLAPDIVKLLRSIDWKPEISFRAGIKALLSATTNRE
nr:NAD(P)-dependent oxidoreductase [uncultured Stomatobaculum sp.]